ncbi:MAG: hypothetical protein QOI72_250 [Solirubrobacterales bacterium]|jgi:phage FluMu protein Com|nr:hypothetical protein [Solirubrobacterales bacterium]
MSRKRNKLGLTLGALLTVLAISGAMLLAGAYAETNNPHFKGLNTTSSKAEETIYSGTSEASGGTQTFEGAWTVSCYHAVAKAKSVTGLDEELEIEVEYFGTKTSTEEPTCETSTGLVVDVNMEGCKYVPKLSAGTTAVVEVKCPVGKEIDIKITNGPGEEWCTVRIGPQKGINHILFHEVSTNNPTRTDLTAEFVLEGLKYKAQPPILCGVKNETENNGKIKGNILFTGTDSTGKNPRDLKIESVTTK